MKKQRFGLLAVVLISVFLASTAGAQSLDDLKQQLDDAKKLIMNLEERIQVLEGEQPEKAAPAPSGTVAAPAAPSQPQGKFSIYGFAQADVIQDFNRVNPDWNAALRPSRIPTVDGLYGEDGETIFSVRQSRIGFLNETPTGWGDFTAKIEADFFGVGSDEGQTTIRPRHFFGELGPVLAGQTHSLFMDINVFPNTIDYWGPAGMVFLRNPQLRYTPIEGDVTFAVALEDPGNDVSWGVSETPDPNGSLNSKNDLPDLTARVNYSGDWGYVQLGGIARKVGFETVGLPDSEPSGDGFGWGLNLSTNVKTFGKDRVIFSTVYGEAIANYMNDGGNDLIVVNGDVEILPLLGMVLYYDHYWTDALSSSVGYSFTSIDNHEQQAGDAFKIGQYGSVNLLWVPWDNTLVGVEYLYGRREDNDGASGEDNRLQFSFKYSFDKAFDYGM